MAKNNAARILLIDDEVEYTRVLSAILKGCGYDVEASNYPQEALSIMQEREFDIVITDLKMPKMDGIQVLEAIIERYNSTQVIIITGYGTIENAVEAMKKGAYTYFVKGHDPEKLIDEIENIMRIKRIGKSGKGLEDNECSKAAASEEEAVGFLLDTKSEKFAKTLEIAKKAARSNVSILLLGESGVGKEVIANFIHENSIRSSGPFVPVNCHAFSDGLLESELFGHEKGAFTGATGSRKGRFEAADEGTIFLDEVGDIPFDTQVKLLRVIESKSIEKIGTNDLKKLNFRLVSATNLDLEEEISMGRFREDFFYRISTIVIKIPPLRERKEDIEDLIDLFVKKAQKEQGISISGISDEVKKFLVEYNYPGNVRELKNIIERLVVLSEDGIMTKDGLPVVMNCKKAESGRKAFEIRPIKEIRNEFEAEYIQKVLLLCGGNVSEAAKLMEISSRQLFNKISEYGLK